MPSEKKTPLSTVVRIIETRLSAAALIREQIRRLELLAAQQEDAARSDAQAYLGFERGDAAFRLTAEVVDPSSADPACLAEIPNLLDEMALPWDIAPEERPSAEPKAPQPVEQAPAPRPPAAPPVTPTARPEKDRSYGEALSVPAQAVPAVVGADGELLMFGQKIAENRATEARGLVEEVRSAVASRDITRLQDKDGFRGRAYWKQLLWRAAFVELWRETFGDPGVLPGPKPPVPAGSRRRTEPGDEVGSAPAAPIPVTAERASPPPAPQAPAAPQAAVLQGRTPPSAPPVPAPADAEPELPANEEEADTPDMVFGDEGDLYGADALESFDGSGWDEPASAPARPDQAAPPGLDPAPQTTVGPEGMPDDDIPDLPDFMLEDPEPRPPAPPPVLTGKGLDSTQRRLTPADVPDQPPSRPSPPKLWQPPPPPRLRPGLGMPVRVSSRE